MLDTVAIFSSIPPDGLTRLAEQGQKRIFPAGSVLMRQGEVSDGMHVVVRGRVQVERSHPDLTEPLVLAELGPGEVVGEMGVLDGEPRSATVIALEETETMELRSAQLAETVLRYPDASAALLRTISRRLRSTNELAEQLQRQGQSRL